MTPASPEFSSSANKGPANSTSAARSTYASRLGPLWGKTSHWHPSWERLPTGTPVGKNFPLGPLWGKFLAARCRRLAAHLAYDVENVANALQTAHDASKSIEAWHLHGRLHRGRLILVHHRGQRNDVDLLVREDGGDVAHEPFAVPRLQTNGDGK